MIHGESYESYLGEATPAQRERARAEDTKVIGRVQVLRVRVTCPHCRAFRDYYWSNLPDESVVCHYCGRPFALDQDALACLEDPASHATDKREARRKAADVARYAPIVLNQPVDSDRAAAAYKLASAAMKLVRLLARL